MANYQKAYNASRRDSVKSEAKGEGESESQEQREQAALRRSSKAKKGMGK